MRRSSRRHHKIVIQRLGAPIDDGMTMQPGPLTTWTIELAEIFYGSGQEQRTAAQQTAGQAASFEVLSNAKTRAISMTDRLRYPVTDPDPDKWPIWDIQSANDLGLNVGVRITATRAAT